MSFILLPKQGKDIQVNAWNWRPTLRLMLEAGLIDDQQHELMGANGRGGGVDSETARKIADFLEQRLDRIGPGKRIRADLIATAAPKKKIVFTPDTRVEDIDAVDAHSATYEWLALFRDFCRTCSGFTVS